MNDSTFVQRVCLCGLALLLVASSPQLRADAVTDWNLTARDLVAQAHLPTPHANRAMALTHTAMYLAVRSLAEAPSETALAAAVATAASESLRAALPNHAIQINAAHQAGLQQLPPGEDTTRGVRAGEDAARAVLTARQSDGAHRSETYRPFTAAGQYVPTTTPAVPQWPQRRPWLLESTAQFRPGPPPSLHSAQWAADFNEVKTLGAANSSERTAEQTAMAKFWEATLPPIYHGVVHSVARQPGRTALQNARLFALVTQATDDAMMAVFEAKYHYAFWRPVTAIRNADLDGHNGTARDPGWRPFIPTPMHPEYPCAHCVVAATVAAVLRAEIGTGEMPELSTQSDTAGGVTRRWSSLQAFVHEVSMARIYDGVHYRSSTVAGNRMGQQIGQHAVQHFAAELWMQAAKPTPQTPQNRRS